MADSRHALVFASILALALIPVVLIATGVVSLPLAILGIFIVGAGAWVAPELVEFKEYERGVVFRFGRFSRQAGPGWTWIFPRFERYERVDLRTQETDMPPQKAMTLDNIRIDIDAIAFWKVKDPVKVVLEVRDPQAKLKQVLVSQLREAVSRMNLDSVQASTDQINAHLSNSLEDVAEAWGIQVTRVEVQHVELPPSLAAAMKKRQEALEYKATVETEAIAKQVALETLNKAASQLDDRTLTYLYLDSLKAVAEGKSTKIVLPLELSKLAHTLSNRLPHHEAGSDYSALARAFLEGQKGAPQTPQRQAGRQHSLREMSVERLAE